MQRLNYCLSYLCMAGVLSFVVLQAAPAGADMPGPNPYAGKSYGGCRGGYCESQDEALELQFWEAASKGDAQTVKKLLQNENLNITRNIVPDEDGLSRVLDVAVWTAAEKGHHDTMRVLLEHPGVPKLYEYEDGHILDMAAANGDLKMVQLLLEFNMTVGPSSLAHAAHFNHTDVMEVLLEKPTDLKSAMQSISNGGSEEMARLMLKALKDRKEDTEQQSQGAYDWYADYVQHAVGAGNVKVLKSLLDGGYVLKWQQAQDLIKLAAETGNTEVMRILLSQKLFGEDADELDEAVDNVLKTAAELGKEQVVELMLQQYPEQSKAHCKAGMFRALKYGQGGVEQLLSKVCAVDVSSNPKLQDAQWLGQVLNAARSGDAAAMKKLLAHDQALARVKKLRKAVEEDAGDKKKGPSGPAIDIKHDPLVIAAVNGHLDVVKQLEELRVLCASCAASEASKKNQSDVLKHLAKGTGKVVLQNFEDVIHDALRIVAYAMEQQNWAIVEWFLQEHDSKDLGPYFFPIIAQEGKLDDMKKMIGVLKKLGYTGSSYFVSQVHSAMISAALNGHLELVLELKQYSDPFFATTDAGAVDDGDDDEVVDDDDVERGDSTLDKTEL